MPDRKWFEEFVARGPDYAARRIAVPDLADLIHAAARAEGLPGRLAEDAAATAKYLGTDPQLLAMKLCALTGPHPRLRVEGTADHVVIEQARVASAAPYLIGKLVTRPARIVLTDLDWPMLLWPCLALARDMYSQNFRIDRTDARTLMVSRSPTDTLAPFGSWQAIPVELLDLLDAMAHRLP